MSDEDAVATGAAKLVAFGNQILRGVVGSTVHGTGDVR